MLPFFFFNLKKSLDRNKILIPLYLLFLLVKFGDSILCSYKNKIKASSFTSTIDKLYLYILISSLTTFFNS